MRSSVCKSFHLAGKILSLLVICCCNGTDERSARGVAYDQHISGSRFVVLCRVFPHFTAFNIYLC